MSYSQPRLEVQGGPIFDLGKVKAGTTVLKKLSVVNAGKDSLIIKDVSTSCGCTVAEVSAKRLAPGDICSLSVTIDMKDISGKVKKEVYISSNETAHPKTTVTFLAFVESAIMVEPRYFNFSTISKGTPAIRSVILRNTTDRPIGLLHIEAKDSECTAWGSREVLNPHDTVKISAMLTPRLKGKKIGQIRIETDNMEEPIVLISYIGVAR